MYRIALLLCLCWLLAGAVPWPAYSVEVDSCPPVEVDSAPLNLNQATVAELDRLPGIGPALAGRIVAWREEHGDFESLEQLGEVRGIGARTLARLRPRLTLE